MATQTLQREYAVAVQSLIEGGMDVERVADGLMRILMQRGHRRLLLGILRALESLKAEQERTEAVTLTVARREDADRFKDEIAAAMRDMHTGSSRETEVDDRIIGGYVLRSGTQQLDASYRRSLLSLYRSITTT